MRKSLKKLKLWEALSDMMGVHVFYDDLGPSLKFDQLGLEELLVETAAAAVNDPLLPHLLMTWVDVHGHAVRTERLALLAKHYHARYCSNLFWLTVAAKYAANEKGLTKWNHVFKTLDSGSMWQQPKYEKETAELRGNMPWLEGTKLMVSQKGLRLRPEDVKSPSELAETNEQYRLRLLFGAGTRADVAWVSTLGKKTPAEVSRTIGTSHTNAKAILADLKAAGYQGL